MPVRPTSRAIGRVGAAVGVLGLATALVVGSSLAATATSQPTPDQTGGAARNHGLDQTLTVAGALASGTKARNVILLIGDGMGDSEITIARDYLYGAGGRLPGIDALPLTGQYTTYSLYKDGDPLAGRPDYTPDSAATGTAWATGTKTYDNAISVDIHNKAQKTLLELAKTQGLRTGNVSTAEIQDATPAVQVAHVAARSCYGPDSPTCGADALVAGGAGSISEQLLDTRPDLTLGGGAATFAQTAKAGEWNGQTLLAQAADRGYQVVKDAASLAAVTKASQESPVLGLFADGNFPTRFAPSTATVGGSGGPATTCTPNPAYLGSGLTLSDLTKKSISLLNDKKAKKGFFLQVEGASIDKRDHAADACGQIGETQDLDEAVQAALAFAKADRNTLVIVTADHAHSSQIVDGATPGLGSTLTTVEGSPLRISYGTAAAGGSQQHTGSQLRIAAYGPGAANVVGLTDQTDTFFTISNALRLNGSLAVEWPVKHGHGSKNWWNSKGGKGGH
nr:alkaline phosphatase [Leifsonia sp. Leaf325]